MDGQWFVQAYDPSVYLSVHRTVVTQILSGSVFTPHLAGSGSSNMNRARVGWLQANLGRTRRKLSQRPKPRAAIGREIMEERLSERETWVGRVKMDVCVSDVAARYKKGCFVGNLSVIIEAARLSIRSSFYALQQLGFRILHNAFHAFLAHCEPRCPKNPA